MRLKVKCKHLIKYVAYIHGGFRYFMPWSSECLQACSSLCEMWPNRRIKGAVWSYLYVDWLRIGFGRGTQHSPRLELALEEYLIRDHPGPVRRGWSDQKDQPQLQHLHEAQI